MQVYVDKRLAGIQTVQTLSRLNRAHPGKDITYVLDFVNKPDEVFAAFKTYYTTAELVDRLMKRFAAAQQAQRAARARDDKAAEREAKDELDALVLFKGDLGAYERLYTFLSQIFDFGSTELEKRAIFYKRLLPLLEFGRERPSIDLSQVKLTHHGLKRRDKPDMALGEGDKPRLSPPTGAGTGVVREPELVYLRAIVERVNSLFEGELSDSDKLVYVNNVLLGKLLESETLTQQARSNSKAQFATSPDLKNELMNAIISALDAHQTMSSQALNSEAVRDGLLDILLDHAQLWESLRAKVA